MEKIPNFVQIGTQSEDIITSGTQEMGQKWLGEELLKFYTFIIFNFRFVSSRHLSAVPEQAIDNELPVHAQDLKEEEGSSQEQAEETPGDKHLVKRRPMSNQFYKDMLEYITKTYGNPNKRLISHLRCKMSKFFGSKDISEESVKESSESASSRLIRWKNSIITFEDLNGLYKEDPSSLLVSDVASHTKKPNLEQEEVI